MMKLRRALINLRVAAVLAAATCGGEARVEPEPLPAEPHDPCSDYAEHDSCCADPACAWFVTSFEDGDPDLYRRICKRRDFLCIHHGEPLRDCPEGYRCVPSNSPYNYRTPEEDNECVEIGEAILGQRGLCEWDPEGSGP